VIVPHLRGYGTTRFLSNETLRNGEQAALALDTVALMDALGIESALVAGFDWGREPPTSSPRCGRNAAAAWSR
jgi:pimeloyl-ACP methyl ester carboxylesterase